MTKKLGIIAGGGDIPKALITKCQEQKRDYFVVAIEGNADKDLVNESVPHIWIRIGQAGTGFKKLAEEKVEEVKEASDDGFTPGIQADKIAADSKAIGSTVSEEFFNDEA